MNTIVGGKNKLLMQYPASWWKNMWREALPAGNGRLGASVYGGIREETILLNHAALWHGGKKDEVPDVSHTLAETREMMRAGKHKEADWHLTNALRERGYDTRLAAKLPLGDIKLKMPCDRAFRNYARSLDMETGEIRIGWEDGDCAYERKLFVSRVHDAVVYEITGSGLDGVAGEITLGLHPTDYPHVMERFRELEKTAATVVDGSEYIYYAATNDDGEDFGAVLRVTIAGGRIAAEGGFIGFAGAERVLALAKVFVSGNREAEWVRLRAELADLDGASYDELLAAHAEEHGRLFRSATLDLHGGRDETANELLLLEAYGTEAPLSLVEKMWSYGRYLFISGTAEGGMPFGMYGLWPGDYDLDWCLNMANENVQMIYWHAAVGGLSELVPALMDYYDGMMDDYRTNARNLYGCRGIYVPAGSTPGIGVPNQVVPVIMNWTGAAGWLSKHYYDYYAFTGDRAFLSERVMPFMREVALFYADFLQTDADGSLRYYPSVSPENSPGNFMPRDGAPMEHPMPTTMNATMDFAILKEFLVNWLSACEETGLYLAEAQQWRDLLARIPAYQTNEAGAIREWMHPDYDDNYEHRHLSHLYPVFPGQEVTREASPELFAAFERAVDLRELGAQSGWSLTHMAAIYARMGRGDRASECLDIMAKAGVMSNFFTVHNDWRDMGVSLRYAEAPVQLDAAMGWVNAVQEMLLYVSPTIVKLLPALPDKWREGRFDGLRFATGSVAVAWNRSSGTFAATLAAERDTAMTVKLPPWAERCRVTGDAASVSSSTLGVGCYEVKLAAGASVTLANV